MTRLLLILCISFAVFASGLDQDSLLSVEIDSNSNGELRASVNDLTRQGIGAEFNHIRLIGTQEVVRKSILGIGKNQIKIFWERVSLNGREVELTEPFYSEIEVDGSIEIGDVFSAKGKPEYLMKAYAQTNQKGPEGQGVEGAIVEEEEENLTNYITSRSSEVDSTPSTLSDNIAEEDTDFGVDFQVAEDAVEEETTDGCSVRISLEDMLAYVQTKIIKGTEEISGCRDGETSYLVVKDYKSCGVVVDTGSETIYDKYALYYNDPNVGKIIVLDCTTDTMQYSSLTRDYNACGFTHDFEEGVSRPLYRLVDNQGVIHKDCTVDEGREYSHNETKSGCPKTFSKDSVIYSRRVSINVDGSEQYISECEPYEEETTDGCSVRISLEDMLAYVQTKIIKGTEEISGCRDGETSYLVVKDYKSCGVVVDTGSETIYDKYALYYNDPNVGKIIVLDCTTDTTQFSSLTRDYNACGITHDFAEGVSRPLYRLVDNQGVIHKDCAVDEGQEYSHNETKSGCAKTLSKDAVIYSKRVSINVEGSEQYISECEPYDANVKIYEEVCTLNKYTHDNTADQSYLNKTYFYFENGNRINIEECVKSATNFSHKFDTALCEVEYDDKNKETTIFARRYIEDTTLGGKVFVDDCEQLNEKVTYLKSDGVWQKSGVITVPFKSPKSEQYGYSVRPYDSWRTFGFLRRYGSPEEIFHKGLVGWQERGRRPIGAPRIFSECKVSLSELKSGFRWMRSVPILQPDQIKLSSQVAKFREDFSNKSSIKADAVREESRVCRVETSTPSGAVNFLLFRIRVSYKNIACEGTLMKKAAIYKRYDGSEYIDNTEVLDTALVCGDGSKLDGKRI